MKCPNCGINNGRTNKFCRECGLKLEWLEEISEHIEAVEQAAIARPLDDVALGEELFSIMRLYEDGDLDAASGRINHIIERSPDSASAHSIRALVCERKADLAASRDDAAASNGYLQEAMAEYEAIIDLNPGSVADREKLVGLRMKLAGNMVSEPAYAARPTRKAQTGLDRLRKRALEVSPPMLAAGLALVVLIVLLSFLIPRGNDAANRRAGAAPRQGQVRVESTPNLAAQPTNAPNTGAGLTAYTFPTPSATPLRPVESAPPPVPAPPASASTKLPPYIPELTLTPVPKDNTPARPAPGRTETSTPRIKITTTTTPDTDTTPASNVPDGTSMLAKAIVLANQKRYAEARQSAQSAIQMYQDDLAADRNTTAAQRGMDNARRYIRLWESM